MSHAYTHAVPFQVLQRDLKTNTATLIVNGEKSVLPVGGPFSVGDCHNIYVGDVWIMAGQSNMRGHGFFQSPFSPQNLSSNLDTHEGICLYDSSENWRRASEPTHHLFASPRAVHHTLPDPTVSTPEICQFRGASLGLAFATEYRKLNNIPVGLVACAHGGTSLNDWKRPTEINEETVQSTLYGAMIDKIRTVGNYQVTGILWYQGETDAADIDDSSTYKERFQEWLDNLRLDTREDIPVVFAQIGPHRVDNTEMIRGWKNVQESQRALFGYKSITAGVATLDCSLDDRVHLSALGLIKVGRRLANAAVLACEKKAEKATPLCLNALFEQIELVRSKLTVYSIKMTFANMEETEWVDNEQLGGFCLENCTNNTAIISIRVEGKNIRLYLTGKPLASSALWVSYGMNKRDANLVTTDGSALPAFKKIHVVDK
ncbi:SGNH hydrolase-type esterase domain-containing protein [Sporodiniella umbellata]|nr:SGNH hydrolase-type esterase domain-containing protein [Sporodiniella umbellata]